MAFLLFSSMVLPDHRSCSSHQAICESVLQGSKFNPQHSRLLLGRGVSRPPIGRAPLDVSAFDSDLSDIISSGLNSSAKKRTDHSRELLRPVQQPRFEPSPHAQRDDSASVGRSMQSVGPPERCAASGKSKQ